MQISYSALISNAIIRRCTIKNQNSNNVSLSMTKQCTIVGKDLTGDAYTETLNEQLHDRCYIGTACGAVHGSCYPEAMLRQ